MFNALIILLSFVVIMLLSFIIIILLSFVVIAYKLLKFIIVISGTVGLYL
jgi:hypothetical protein